MSVYNYRKKLKLPEVRGVKVLQIGSNSTYLRWTFLSTHSLSTQQLEKLTFELKTMDNSINSECSFALRKAEYKVRLEGLQSNTKYKFMIRCKLKYNHEMLHSPWSSYIEFTTKPNKFTIITNYNDKKLDIESLLHEINELEIKNKELNQLILKLNVPVHHLWDYTKIVEWVLRLEDGMFKPYKKTLLTNLKCQQIDGKYLCQLQLADLHRFGVTKFTHKKILISHIHKLTENDENKRESVSPKTQIPINDTHFAPPHDMENDGKCNMDNDGLTNSAKKLLISVSSSYELPKKWKYKNGVLSLFIIGATNVDNMDEDEGPGSASDPYVEIELKGHYKTERTKVIQNNANPVWNERFQLFPANPKKDILKLKMWDKDVWTFDDKIGIVHIPVIDVLNANGHINKTYDIKGSQCGAKLNLELRYKELQH